MQSKIIQIELRNYFAKNKTIIKNSFETFFMFIEASFIVCDHELVSYVASFYLDFEVRVSFQESLRFHEIACEWSYVQDSNIPAFTFHRLNRCAAVRHIVDRWLSLIDLYRINSKLPFTGGVILDLEDAGLGVGLAFCDNRSDSFLIPDPNYMSSKGYRTIREFYLQNLTRWNDRSGTVFWRGSTTGRRANEGDVFSLPRIELCSVVRSNPDLFDVGISNIVQVSEAEEALIQNSGFMTNYVPWTELVNYKFHIDIDGNSNAWQSTMSKFLSGGLVFKVKSPFDYRQWYYDLLIPNVNYVSVKSDLSDLVEKVQYFAAHESEAQEIALKGQALALDMDYNLELVSADKVVRLCSVTHGVR